MTYKYNEDDYMEELWRYIQDTYNEHYSQNKYQATEFIIDSGHGEGFTLGNVMKYTQRYGKKEGRNRKDLLKVLHYTIMALYVHDTIEGNDKDIRNSEVQRVYSGFDGPDTSIPR